MTQSTKLLFRLIRVRLGVGMAVAYVLFLILALFQVPLDIGYLAILAFIGFILAMFMGLHGMLGDTMFPVTDRQVAWIPMAAWGLVSLAGAAGLIVGQAIVVLVGGRMGIFNLTGGWFLAVRLLPSVLLLLLLFWRDVRINVGFFGFFGFFPTLVFNPDRGGIIDLRMMKLYLDLWPVWALGCLFLIWESPRQMAVLRRMDYQEGGAGPFKARAIQLGGPARPTWPTRLADGLTGLVAIVLCALLVAHLFHAPAEQIRRNPFQLFFLFLLFIPIGMLVNGWRTNRASGMGPGRALAVLLVVMTGVGYPFRDLLGVARGARVRCPFCGGWRMAWGTECPACGDRQPVPERQAGQDQPGIGSVLWPRYDPGALFFRGMIPIYLLFTIVIFNWSRWFGR